MQPSKLNPGLQADPASPSPVRTSASTRRPHGGRSCCWARWAHSRLSAAAGSSLAATTRREERRSQCGADDRHGRARQPRPVAARIRRDLRQPSRCRHPRAEGAEGREPPARGNRSPAGRAQGREPGHARRRPGRDRCDLRRERGSEDAPCQPEHLGSPELPPPAYGPQAGGYDARGRSSPPLGGAPVGSRKAACPGPAKSS
jgi:hypothetical protein